MPPGAIVALLGATTRLASGPGLTVTDFAGNGVADVVPAGVNEAVTG